MDPRSLTFSFLLPLFALSGQGPTAPSHSPSTSPASSPSPSPSPRTVSPPTAQYPPPPGPTEYLPPPGLVPRLSATSNQLNVGEKVGLAFLSVVLVLQLALGGFLISKRLQLRNMALVGRRIETPSPAGSP